MLKRAAEAHKVTQCLEHKGYMAETEDVAETGDVVASAEMQQR